MYCFRVENNTTTTKKKKQKQKQNNLLKFAFPSKQVGRFLENKKTKNNN